MKLIWFLAALKMSKYNLRPTTAHDILHQVYLTIIEPTCRSSVWSIHTCVNTSSDLREATGNPGKGDQTFPGKFTFLQREIIHKWSQMWGKLSHSKRLAETGTAASLQQEDWKRIKRPRQSPDINPTHRDLQRAEQTWLQTSVNWSNSEKTKSSSSVEWEAEQRTRFTVSPVYCPPNLDPVGTVNGWILFYSIWLLKALSFYKPHSPICTHTHSYESF